MNHEIRHEVGIKASPEEIYKALTDTKKLAQWWTADTRGNGAHEGDVLEFWFGGEFCQKFRVAEAQPGKRVRWKDFGEGMEDWQGTEITFTLTPDKDQTWLEFTHSNWKTNEGSFPHCSTKWAVFMLSLKDLLEKGKGRPAPDDIPINHS